MQDVYDFFFDVNGFLAAKGLGRLEDTLRKAILSGCSRGVAKLRRSWVYLDPADSSPEPNS